MTIRQGNEPFSQDGTVAFTLNPGESLLVSFGDPQNMFLNGLLLFTIFNGDLYSKI